MSFIKVCTKVSTSKALGLFYGITDKYEAGIHPRAKLFGVPWGLARFRKKLKTLPPQSAQRTFRRSFEKIPLAEMNGRLYNHRFRVIGNPPCKVRGPQSLSKKSEPLFTGSPRSIGFGYVMVLV